MDLSEGSTSTGVGVASVMPTPIIMFRSPPGV